MDTVSDVGSGLNDKRKGLYKLMKLAKENEITDIAILYKDRLTRFGYGYLEEYFNSHGVYIHVLDQEEEIKTVQEELADDLISIITSFSIKLYGLRSKKHKELQKTAKESIMDVQNLSNQVEERHNTFSKITTPFLFMNTSIRMQNSLEYLKESYLLIYMFAKCHLVI